ncbi:MAG: hypothetical protein V1845_02225 [bacterium]
MAYETEFLISLLLTLAIEIPVAVLAVKYVFKAEATGVTKIIFAGFIASFSTLPYLWFVLPALITERTMFYIVGEASVILAEAIIYRQLLNLKTHRALTISFFANLASFLAGFLFIY